ncbi:histidine biosynthesis trifunctional-protein [Peniophora sp. CONT]|nr:histidine biosynthesis trifunctional-protein [Peniophora sp. CONT]
MTAFLPLLDSTPDAALLAALDRLGPAILPALPNSTSLPDYTDRFVLADHDTSLDQAELVDMLDRGAQKLVVPLAWAPELVGSVPAERLILLLDVASISTVSEKVRAGISGVLLRASSLDADLVAQVSSFFSGCTLYVYATSDELPTLSALRAIRAAGATPVLRSSQLTLSATSTASQLSLADVFLAPLTSDRPDGLFATVVSSYPHSGRTLGLVYSSRESIAESIATGKGVYQSRKHGLWRKGETSGATQEVVRIRLDCDADALEFSVVQRGSGFCHLPQPSCFGQLDGLAKLEATLQSRLESAPEGSYTHRLFNDPNLLRAKIMEEADELCTAQTREEIAFEAADLFYFALTRCVAAGVSLADIERGLDAKALKVSRRAGNAKPQWTKSAAAAESKPLPPVPTDIESPAPSPAPASAPVSDAPIRMRTYTLSSCNASERANLLRRPVLKFDEMMIKVRPIVDDVRARGDAALLDLTAKFDKATLDAPVLRPPFAPEAMELPEDVRKAIDQAYANVRKFHAAQVSGTLEVETMPGVVCRRFARPIARVGLYVPGGTAILPSTALMLGVPAQVAGCGEIVLATPPRPDGSVSPEVLYVAHLVGAHAVLRAGGAQAVAALAYGTETTPKVDKIFGPGNQWVTAAKMLVQNDTDALVAIDMPAGPSEVLVVADYTAEPAFVAADLLSQAEHGVDSQVVLVAVSLSEEKLAAIEAALDEQARALSRVDIMRQSIPKSIIIRVDTVEEGLQFSNDYAPEHLILHLEDAPGAVELVQNAGSVFVGPYSPESCGDYASGTNHTLPTNGYARQFSGVNTLSFQKSITSQELTRDGLRALGPVVATLADCEGLDAHANAVRIRLAALKYQAAV